MAYGNYPDLSKIKKILIIKLRHLGDVLLSSSLPRILKKNIFQAEIDFCVYKEAVSVLEKNPYISEIFAFDRKNKKNNLIKHLKKEFEIFSKVRKKKYDMVINLTEGDRGAIISKISKAKVLVGYDEDLKKWWKKNIYTHLVKTSSNRHAVEKNLDFARRIGINPSLEERDLFFNISKNGYLSAENFLKEKKFTKNNFILINPTAKWWFKCYPLHKLVKLSKMLIEKKENLVFIAGKENFEKEMVDKIIFEIDKNEKVLSLVGKTSIEEAAALIDMSKILICMDSFCLHLSSALKKKVVAIFGPTSEKNWGPWKNENARVVFENLDCRPCFKDGCGGSKICDCLHNLKEEKILKEIYSII